MELENGPLNLGLVRSIDRKAFLFRRLIILNDWIGRAEYDGMISRLGTQAQLLDVLGIDDEIGNELASRFRKDHHSAQVVRRISRLHCRCG
jgi:hypothetical protein